MKATNPHFYQNGLCRCRNNVTELQSDLLQKIYFYVFIAFIFHAVDVF